MKKSTRLSFRWQNSGIHPHSESCDFNSSWSSGRRIYCCLFVSLERVCIQIEPPQIGFNFETERSFVFCFLLFSMTSLTEMEFVSSVATVRRCLQVFGCSTTNWKVRWGLRHKEPLFACIRSFRTPSKEAFELFQKKKSLDTSGHLQKRLLDTYMTGFWRLSWTIPDTSRRGFWTPLEEVSGQLQKKILDTFRKSFWTFPEDCAQSVQKPFSKVFKSNYW